MERGTGIVVVPFGSVEYQGRHLPLGADAFVADAVGRAVADRLDAVLAPTFRVGCSDQHMHGAGTLTVPAETLRELATHVAQSLVTHGFGVLALVSTHRGDQASLRARHSTDPAASRRRCMRTSWRCWPQPGRSLGQLAYLGHAVAASRSGGHARRVRGAGGRATRGDCREWSGESRALRLQRRAARARRHTTRTDWSCRTIRVAAPLIDLRSALRVARNALKPQMLPQRRSVAVA